ncbi:MAG: glycosyltransferase family A protein [Gemmatimonadota bacterium]
MADGTEHLPEPAADAETPVVSVILPTRNRAGSLQRALRSALSQYGVSLEVLVVDDASTDGTADLLATAAASDARIRVLRQPECAGGAVARNRGAKEAAAPFLAFLDDDDEWLPGKLERQVALAMTSGAGVVSCGFAEVAESGTAVRGGDVDLGAVPARAILVRGNVLGLSATLVRRDAFGQVGGFDARLPRLQDWDLWLRLAAAATFRHVPDALAVIHRSPHSISTEPHALARAAEILAAKHAPVPQSETPAGGPRGLTPAEHAELLLALARLLVRDGQDRSGRRFAARSLAPPPWRPRRVAAGLLMSLAPGVYRRITRPFVRRSDSAREAPVPAKSRNPRP